MKNKNKVNTATGQATKIQEALDNLRKDDNEEADIDIYGADQTDDVNSADLDGSDDTVDIGDIDDSDISDDEDQVQGQDVSDEGDEFDSAEGSDIDPQEVIDQLEDLLDQLKASLGGGDDDLDMDVGEGESEDTLFDPDTEEELEESAVQRDLDENERIEVTGVKGAQSKPFRKVFKNMREFNNWQDRDEAGDYEIQRVQNVENTQYRNPKISEDADPSSWNGKMQTLKAPSGQDGSQKTVISDPTVAKSSQKAKALPKGNKPSGQEGNSDYKEVLKKTSDAGKAGPKASVPKAAAILDVVQKMLASDTATIQALYKPGMKLKAMESLNFDMSDAAKKIAKSDNLSEEAMKIAGDMFTVKLRERVEEAVDIIEAQYAISMAEALEEINKREEALVEKLDEYLGYVTESYFEENKIALEEGATTEITESFMDGLRGLFEEHYIEVPKGKTNMVEKLQAELEQTKTKLQETVNKAIKFRNVARNLKKDKLVNEATAGMSLNEAANFKKLIEDVDYNGDDELFNKRITRLKEAHFGRRKVTQTKPEFETLAEETQKPNGAMDRYLGVLKRTI
jgi:hypothetical protein